jgi:hypothetical protein
MAGTEASMRVGAVDQEADDVKHKLELAADGSKAMDNVGAIDGAAVPGISGGVGRLHKDFIGSMVVGINGGGFVTSSRLPSPVTLALRATMNANPASSKSIGPLMA